MPVKPVPDGYATVTPMLLAENADALLKFLQAAFETKQLNHIKNKDGSLMASDLSIGTASVSVCAAGKDMPAYKSVLYVYVPDADAAYRRGIAAGAKSLQEPKDESHGDRMGGFEDPAGNQWWIASRIEDLAPEELARRMQEFHDQHEAGQGAAA
jgi:PhnB protein